MAAALLERLASAASPEWLVAEARALRYGAAARAARLAPHRGLSAGRRDARAAVPGLLRYLAWTAMARFLRPVVNAFDAWRDEERWLRRYCPTCGSLPAMAQLVGADPGRKRLLSCGCCGTRWQFKRTGCPFCETDSQRLASVTIEGEPGLRIDHCESCSGYLKTYDGAGRRDPAAVGLVFTPSRSDRARSRTEKAGRVALRIRADAAVVAISGGSTLQSAEVGSPIPARDESSACRLRLHAFELPFQSGSSRNTLRTPSLHLALSAVKYGSPGSKRRRMRISRLSRS